MSGNVSLGRLAKSVHIDTIQYLQFAAAIRRQRGANEYQWSHDLRGLGCSRFRVRAI